MDTKKLIDEKIPLSNWMLKMVKKIR
jgi:hypothetical protein